MKHLILLFTIFSFLFACNDNAADTSSDEMVNEVEPPQQQLHFKGDGAKIVLVSGDEEYRSEEALPQLARILNTHHDFDCTVLFAQHPDTLGIVNPNYTKNIPSLEALTDADLMILFTRFRELPNEQMEYFEDYLTAGKPLIGIRTATHAFHFTDSTHQWAHWGNYSEEEGWEGGFGRLVLGERWHTHHGHHKYQSTRGIIEAAHPITRGIKSGEIWGSTDVYGIRLPLPGDTQPLVFGQVVDSENEYDENDLFYGMRETDEAVAAVNPAAKEKYNPNEPMMPIAWIKSYQLPDSENNGQAFTSTIGSSSDLLNAGVRRLLVNATYHLLNKEVPESATVDLVGEYKPSPYAFRSDDYWREQGLVIEGL
ncbi:MAG: ThuA domain-containing protein [Bacteroidota bacterium]